MVSDSSLYQAIAQLRRALGDSAKQPRYIETVPKRGYRLIAPVGLLDDTQTAGTATDATVTVSARPSNQAQGVVLAAAREPR